MENEIRILVVDDHQLMIDGIVMALNAFPNYKLSSCNHCDAAFQKLREAHLTENTFDILFTDLSFENNPQGSRLDGGESLIKAVREAEIPVKIGVISGHTETNRVFHVIKNLEPDAYILKSSCNSQDLDFAIKKMLSGAKFYTHEIHEKIMNRNIIQIQMDEAAIQILKELPKQAKISNLEGRIKKSDGKYMKLRAIENKLANLRIDLDANNNTDLVLKAKELGIID